MGEHFDTVASRLKNMLARITAKDPDFDDMCRKHASLTTQIRAAEPADSAHNDALRRRRSALEEQMLTIMSANTRV